MFAKSIDNFLNCGYNKGEHFFMKEKFFFHEKTHCTEKLQSNFSRRQIFTLLRELT